MTANNVTAIRATKPRTARKQTQRNNCVDEKAAYAAMDLSYKACATIDEAREPVEANHG